MTTVAAMPPRPVKVLFLNDTSRNGGPGRTLHAILKFLDEKEFFRGVVLPRPGVVSDLLVGDRVVDALTFEPGLIENPFEPWTRAMVREDFSAPTTLKALRLSGNTLRATVGMAKLASRIRREAYDVIFCNGTSANFAGAALGGLVGVPVVWHVFYSSLGKPLVPLHRALSAGAAVRSVLCVSKPVSHFFDHCREKVRIVHDAIDASAYAPASCDPELRTRYGIPADAFVIGTYGRILPRKGFVEFVQAAARTLEILPEALRKRATFVVLGDTPEDVAVNHVDECKALARTLRIEHKVLFTGYVAPIAPMLLDFDVAVVPSVYVDPLPRSVLEAMAAEKPVVAFDNGGISEMVIHEQTGLLVKGDPPDVPGLAEAIARYVQDPALARQHGRLGRQRVLEHFDALPHANRIAEELRRAAARPRAADGQ